MSGSLNKVILIGNLGRDPELKMTPGGQALARFSLATTETWKNQNGEKQSKTEWHNIVVWGKQAEVAEKYLRKGKQILVEGRIQYREYQDQAGVKKTACDIRCDNFVMLGRMDEGGPRPSAGGHEFEESLPTPPPAGVGGSGGGYDDDIPF
ncbi:MAG TPA: single-stranded DNA-binding protein [Holophaga sp.]|nr:single-stranded DNA-binding protein [Holophaga sp.]